MNAFYVMVTELQEKQKHLLKITNFWTVHTKSGNEQ